MMDKISFTDANVKKIMWLGRCPDQLNATPRPMKLILESEAHKEQVLESKKLEEYQGRRFCQNIYSSTCNFQGKEEREAMNKLTEK